jgi:hypothetical protein
MPPSADGGAQTPFEIPDARASGWIPKFSPRRRSGRPLANLNRDFGNPETPDPGEIGIPRADFPISGRNRESGPESRKVFRSRPNRDLNPGMLISIFLQRQNRDCTLPGSTSGRPPECGSSSASVGGKGGSESSSNDTESAATRTLTVTEAGSRLPGQPEPRSRWKLSSKLRRQPSGDVMGDAVPAPRLAAVLGPGSLRQRTCRLRREQWRISSCRLRRPYVVPSESCQWLGLPARANQTPASPASGRIQPRGESESAARLSGGHNIISHRCQWTRGRTCTFGRK